MGAALRLGLGEPLFFYEGANSLDVDFRACVEELELPAEFIRKGGFADMFFVDLPNAEARRAMIEIPLRRRRQELRAFRRAGARGRGRGFSGSEIEPAIVSPLFAAFAQSGAPGSDFVLAKIATTRLLSLTMAERLASPSDRAHRRCEWPGTDQDRRRTPGDCVL